jgi:hypothetical protein
MWQLEEILVLLRARSGLVGVSRQVWRILHPCSLIPSQRVRLFFKSFMILNWLLVFGSIGLFAGLSLEGTVLIERKDANRDFYGSPVPARDILGGRVPPPEVASKLYEIIEAAEGLDESGVPEAAYVPTATGEHIKVDGGNHTVFDAEGHWVAVLLARGV